MDGYAPAYVAHDIPLLIVSGLGSSARDDINVDHGGHRVCSEIPPVVSDDALTLLRHFRDSDASHLAWNGREHNSRNKFRVKTIGRDYVLPARKAQLPASSVSSSVSHGSTSTPRLILHSALSPLSPGSSIFPDGLLDQRWIDKHRELIPSAFIFFYAFTPNSNLSTLQDNQLKTDINNIKSTLSQAGCRSRLVVCLLSEKSIVQSPEVEERLVNIRRATGLDSKTSLFLLPPQSSAVELQAFVATILSAIYPLCIEYYRDLSKHARRKRNRGVIPPPTTPPTTGTSQTLTGQGWNVRYDFKLGVFAEFRQEMDAAVRSYESGYEALLGPDVLETIASWSPRWNEARLLADVFAIRIIRCLLWNDDPIPAVRRWHLHRAKMRDFVDRRGKGSSTYGWEAWEARWATIMAEMIKKTSIFEFNPAGSTICLPVDKSVAIGEKIEPWEFLQHPGYWFRTASKHLIARRALALTIPEEDRSPPGSSPASLIASKAHTYDTYLCPEPHEESPLPGRKGVDHSALIVDLLSKSVVEFEQNNQHRLAQELKVQSANESLKREAWADALRVLRPLWQAMTYRREGWWAAVEEIGWALRNAAAHVGDGGSIVAVDWELLNRSFAYHSNWHYDLAKSLRNLDTVKARPAVVLHDLEVHSFLSGVFTFEHPVAKVGEPCSSQVVVTSSALEASVPVTITEIRVEFEGNVKPVVLRHGSTTAAIQLEPGRISLSRILLTDGLHERPKSQAGSIQNARPTLTGAADLEIRPNEAKVFEFSSLPREAGEAKAVSITFSFASDLFDLDYIQSLDVTEPYHVWWSEKSVKKKIVRESASSIVILPKPPKLELQLFELRKPYYTNENIDLRLEITNREEVDSIVNLDVRVLGDYAPLVIVNLPSTSDNEVGRNEEVVPTALALGRISTSSSKLVEMRIPSVDLPAVYDLTIKTSYHLISDMETPVSRSMSAQLEVVNPFEANYDFSPRVHPDPWPSFFCQGEADNVGMSQQDVKYRGLAQKWCLTAKYASFATEVMIVEDVDVDILGVNGAIQCRTKKLTTLPEGGLPVRPQILEVAQFDVFTRKLSLDDRGTATLDVTLMIKWRRGREGAMVNTTTLAVPRLLVSSSEPRVLGSVSYSTALDSMIVFYVTIENPSNHFLSFALTMEPSETFAFSGPKQSTLQLVPLSRRTTSFKLLPCVRGNWIGPIHCVIRDRYFQKVLKIAPTEGLKLDKDGLFVWVPQEENGEH